MITIEDVAREAGVSTATVSRLLNGTARVNDDTAERIHKCVAQLGYEPNLLGRGLRAKKTNMVLVIISTIVNSFYAKAIKGVEDAAQENGFSIILGTNYDDAAREKAYLSMLRNHLVDGVIVMRPVIPCAELDALQKKFPVVQCCEYIKECAAPFVSIDHYGAAYEACEYLIKNGHRKIGLMSASDNSLTVMERTRGYMDAIRDNHLDASYCAYGDYGYKRSYYSTAKLIEDGVTAVFALSDRMAAGVVAAARDKGLSVPDDLSVIGFDNVEISKIITPQLTTVSQNQYEMGMLAMNKLACLIGGVGNIKSEFIKYSLIERNSVKRREDI